MSQKWKWGDQQAEQALLCPKYAPHPRIQKVIRTFHFAWLIELRRQEITLVGKWLMHVCLRSSLSKFKIIPGVEFLQVNTTWEITDPKGSSSLTEHNGKMTYLCNLDCVHAFHYLRWCRVEQLENSTTKNSDSNMVYVWQGKDIDCLGLLQYLVNKRRYTGM